MGRGITTERLWISAGESMVGPHVALPFGAGGFRPPGGLGCSDRQGSSKDDPLGDGRSRRVLEDRIELGSLSLATTASLASVIATANAQKKRKDRVTAMATWASNSTEGRLMRQDRSSHVSVGLEDGRPASYSDPLPSTGSSLLNPTVQITPAEQVKRLGTGWHWWFSESIHVPIGTKIEFRFQGPKHLLVLYNEGVRRNGETSINGLHPSNLRSFMHKLTFVPAGCAYREWHETGASTRVTFLYLDAAALHNSDDGDGALSPRMYFEDSLVWETASRLKNTIESGHARYLPYLEALSGVLAHELSRTKSDAAHEPMVNRGGLASWQKRAVVDYIEEHPGKQVCLLTLAGLTRLSLHHFCRAFKQSFGIPPHQYQVQRRMEVAKLLLADQTTSVTDIALSLGYAQTSSFSTAFRKTTGWTPMAYRREFK
jgi:AraC family transcriptional regulator